jgi:hypothetical protein
VLQAFPPSSALLRLNQSAFPCLALRQRRLDPELPPEKHPDGPDSDDDTCARVPPRPAIEDHGPTSTLVHINYGSLKADRQSQKWAYLPPAWIRSTVWNEDQFRLLHPEDLSENIPRFGMPSAVGIYLHFGKHSAPTR